jgi:hypothetical protein
MYKDDLPNDPYAVIEKQQTIIHEREWIKDDLLRDYKDVHEKYRACLDRESQLKQQVESLETTLNFAIQHPIRWVVRRIFQ